MEPVSSTLLETCADFDFRGPALAKSPRGAAFPCEVRLGERSLWILARFQKGSGFAVRAAYSPDAHLELIAANTESNALTVELAAPVGRWRVRCEFPKRGKPVLHFSSWLMPAKPLKLPFWPRDLYPFGKTMDPAKTHGTVHTAQRGPRTGLLFATLEEPSGGTVLYLQNFTALNPYSAMTQTTPAGRVGGTWPELGYSPAPAVDHALKEANEVCFYDTFVALERETPANDRDAARLFLDMLAELYLALPRPEPAYHDWPTLAAQTVRDLAFSPKCSYYRQGRRFLMPYTGDEEKPPESMVQLTVCMALLEFERWSGREIAVTGQLLDTLEAFYNPKIGCCVRWLPGERFGDTGEAGQNHENMDSWYLYHTLFNLSRLASGGNKRAERLFRRSLPYAMRVAKRFDYEFPIFFNVNTLEVVRAESKPGSGGEHDVAGLYALVMLHAQEMYREPVYMSEAKKAAAKLSNLGFKLGYQMNTTGFAAEALLRLYQQTGELHYLENSYVCLANMFENMWIWNAGYGHAVNYPTFFALFPLRDAPYAAPYEELEALAKFYLYEKLGGTALRPSVRRLISEYCKYVADRAWHYFPAHLPPDVLAEKSRNGKIERGLAIPLEDLQDGYERSGEVGQEIYGAGLALVCATRFYTPLPAHGVQLFCDYPIEKLAVARNSCRFRTGGDERASCRVRLIPNDPARGLPRFELRLHGASGKPEKGSVTAEGHLVFNVAGASDVLITWGASKGRSRRSRL